MKHLLFAALVLGCVLAHVSASGEFEFHDSEGNCWRCTPGNSCERCSTPINRRPSPPITLPSVLPVWPNQCVRPDCQNLRTLQVPLSTLFPSTTLRNYFQCVNSTTQADTWVAEERNCPCDTLFSYELQACVFPFNPNWIPHCANFVDSETEKCPGVPTPEEPTTTTEAATRDPCTCMPWWPCWCNPCWNMPCHSCSGCMMG